MGSPTGLTAGRSDTLLDVADLNPVLGELVTLALVISLSPLSVIPGVLVLHSPRPRPTSLTFLLGWILGIAGLTAVFVTLSRAIGDEHGEPRWSAYLRVIIGAALIVLGGYRWVNRKHSQHTPAWMRSMSGMGPSRALVVAAALAVLNPKVLFMCAAAGLVIGAAGMGTGTAWSGVALFTAIAASSVALPVLAYQIAGARLDAPLQRLKTWMEANHAALIAAILFFIGGVLIYKGIHSL